METMTERVLKVGKQYRDFSILREDVDRGKRTVALSFSSETDQVQRRFGVEILDHSPGAVDLTRLKRSGALLLDHDPRDQVGVIEEVTVGADRKGRAVVRFGRSAKAQEIFQDVTDGIRKNVSVGYEPFEMKLERTQEDGPDVYRVTKWMPFEISLVSIPADIDVGVGRAGEDEGAHEITVLVPEKTEARQADPPAPEKPITEVRNMDKCKICGGDTADGKCPNAGCAAAAAATVQHQARSAQQMEQDRKTAIENLARTNNIPENIKQMWVDRGYDLNAVAKDLVTIMEERGRTNPQPLSKIGMSPAETQRFSLVNAIAACANNDWSKAGFEAEASRTVAQKLNRMPDPRKFYVPFEVLQRPISTDSSGYRDLTAGTTNAGGYLVATDNVGFIEMLRKRSVAMRMGARMLSGLQGNVTIPKQTAGATAYWLSTEATQATEGGLVFAQISLTPNNVAAYVEISRQLLLQSNPGAEGIVSNDLAKQVALAADLAALEGTGTEQPLGISGTSGIGSFTGATLSYAAVLNAQEDVASADVIPLRGGYVTTPAVASICMQRVKFTSTASPLWEGNIWDGSMVGFPAMSSNQLSASTMIFGDWSELIYAEFGILEVEVNPYANFQAGIIGVRAMYSMDVALRWPAAFSRATGIT